MAAGLLVCAAGGALFAWIHSPLPWMIGSIVAMAAARMMGADLAVFPWGRNAGLVIVGTSLGLHFTSPVIHEVSSYWPWFVALGFAAIGFGGASGWILSRLSGVDRATCYFGSMPGGASEMAMTGERHGARPDFVAFAHSVRMLFTVTLFPIAITFAGFSASDDWVPISIPFDAPKLVLLLAIGTACGWMARRIGLPTAYMIGSLLATTALTVNGVVLSSVPHALPSAAQVLLGAALGVSFDRGFLRKAPRFALSLIPSIATTLVSAALVGWALAHLAGVYIGTGLLAAAPGGIAEMSITAQVLRMGVAFVTAAHAVRYIIVVLFTGSVFRLLRHGRSLVHARNGSVGARRSGGGPP
jgi:membrane AbrB-like protein